jgi:uncharacterized protein (TIGR00251 family)
MENRFGFKDGKAGAAITVRVSTRSSLAEIGEVMDDGAIKIRLTSAPVDGKANEELIKLLSKDLKVPKTNIEIITGFSGKTKIIAIYGYDSGYINNRIYELTH